MKPKISFFVINHSDVGGVEIVTSDLISLFIYNNINVHSLISLGDENESSIIKFDNNIIIKSFKKNDITKALPEFLEENNITHLIFQGDNNTIARSILKSTKNINCKSYLHYHGSPYANLVKNLYWSDVREKPINIFKILIAKIVFPLKKIRLLNTIKKSIDGFITVSNGSKDEINSLFNTDFKNITCIHNPASLKPNNEVIIEKKEKRVVLISRLVRKHKNVFLAIRVWKEIYNKHPDWELQILGSGKLLFKINEYIEKNKIKNIDLVGLVNNVDEYLSKSSISISTSDTEGFSMAVYESIAYSNPIVATNSYGGVHDMVKESENGFFSPRNNAKEMAINLEKLMNDDRLRIEMGNDSYLKFINLQKENIFRQWMEILNINF